MTKLEEFEELRALLFSIAYRILGSVAEAEDAVQECWLRFDASPTRPASVRGFLSTVVTRISIDVLRSARARREQYVGPWLPEPLLLLERLSPLERAVFVLRDVFGFGFDEIAMAVGRSEAACRQLTVRARRHMSQGRPRFGVADRDREQLAARFFEALRVGDIAGLQDLLAADVMLVGDGGGNAPQLARAVAGNVKVARLLGTVVPLLARIDAGFQRHDINGQPGAILRDREGRVLHTLTLDILDGQIQAVRLVVNPDKLGHVGPVGDAWAVDREIRRVRRPGGGPGTPFP